jgi:hypothetical protein
MHLDAIMSICYRELNERRAFLARWGQRRKPRERQLGLQELSLEAIELLE